VKFELKLPQLTGSDDGCAKIQVSIFSKYFDAKIILIPCALDIINSVSFKRARNFLHNLSANQILAANDCLQPIAFVLNQLGAVFPSALFLY
jgi:hypothetical protein